MRNSTHHRRRKQSTDQTALFTRRHLCGPCRVCRAVGPLCQNLCWNCAAAVSQRELFGAAADEDVSYWREQLEKIREVARRKRLLGRADPLLEAGVAHLERRLAAMQRGEADA